MYQNKRTALTDFTEISGATHLDNTSFSDLYYWHYFDRTAALKKEIIENLNSLPPARFNTYIKYVKDEIHEVYGYYNPDKCIIGKWIKKFDLVEEDFPFYDNDEVTYLLSVNSENYKSESEKKEINIILMQLEFHWYAGHLEYLKMKRFIDELLPMEIDIKSSNEKISFITVSEAKQNFQNTTWFKVGLLFAKGEVQELYEKYKSERGHFKKITLELGFKATDRPYFSETINNSTDGNKNIYSDLSKMKKIHYHCKKNEILICEDFDKNFNALQTKQT